MKPFILALLAAAALLLAGCVPSTSNEETPAGDTGLHGRVLGRNNQPVSGVTVSLARNGASDTTDVLGQYDIPKMGGDVSASDPDTLLFKEGQQNLASLRVTSWTDSLPDVYIVQRDISGLLRIHGATITRVEALVYTETPYGPDTVTKTFYYNPLASNYSGFAYFPPSVDILHYWVVINVYGENGRLSGQSQTVPFNSLAGNITVPVFDANNALPAAQAGPDTTVSSGATARLHGTAVDSIGTITTWEWSLGGDSFVPVSAGDTTFSRTVPGTYPCILRVTDNDGNLSADTLFVNVTSP